MSSPTPHAPLGANVSFNFGPPGAAAGFALPSSASVAENVYVGCRHSAAEPWALLPFFASSAGGPPPLPKGRFGRFLAWAGDKWMIGPLVFKLCTPFESGAAPSDETFAYAPVVCGYLEYDNTHSSEAVELVFGVGTAGSTVESTDAVGFAFNGTCGFATAPSAEVTLRRGTAVFSAEIGAASALHFAVPPHAKRIYPLVLGFYQPGFFYSTHFADLAAVLRFGLAQHARYLALADARDADFMRSTADFAAKGRIAHDTRVWLAQSRRAAETPPVDPAGLRELIRRVTG